jgi:serine phosphatase RsbU (regulator of sigma subunit)
VDVVGHGVESTRVALDVTHALRTLSREGHELADLVALADALLEGTGSLATVLLGRLDPCTGEIALAAGGHPPAPLLPARTEPEYIEAKGRPIGFPGAGSLNTSRVRLIPGDTLLLYTDGILTAVRAEGGLRDDALPLAVRRRPS